MGHTAAEMMNDDERDEVQKHRAAAKRWLALGYVTLHLGDKTLWVCPVDSQPVVDPDVHQNWHWHLLPLHVPAPFSVDSDTFTEVWASPATEPEGYSDRVRDIVTVNGVRSAVIGSDGRSVPTRDLVPASRRESIYQLIERVTATGHYAPDSY